MKFEVYGKQKCAMCDSTKQKLGHLIEKSGLAGRVEVAFIDMDTVMGRAEGAFYDVHQVPTTILRDPAGEERGRWVAQVPPSEAVRGLASPMAG